MNKNEKSTTDTHASIYSETPGTNQNNGLQGNELEAGKKVASIAEETLENQEEEAKQDTLNKEDTSGEAG